MMDDKNLFVTKKIYYYNRLDYVVVLVLSIVLIYLNWKEFNFLNFFIMLAWPDVIGFYPAALWYFLQPKREQRSIPALFYYIYNISHGALANVCIILVWAYLVGGWRWEMLAFPVHLGVDRGLFGLFYKSRKISFIPKEHGEFKKFRSKIATAKDW